MTPGRQSFKKLGAFRVDLEQPAHDRGLDADALCLPGRHASSIAMELYALEIMLEMLICERLDLTQLPQPFELNELEGLLILSGLKNAMGTVPRVETNWDKLVTESKAINDLRYKPASAKSHVDSDGVRSLLHDPTDGVMTWLRTHL
jgi:hypothetical protein